MLAVNDLKAGYGDKVVVNLPLFKIEKGKKCLIRGESGSGKTTLLYAIAGLGEVKNGAVMIDGTDVYNLDEPARDRFRGEKIGIVFQTLHLVKSLTVLENILLGSFVNRRDQDVAWAEELLKRLGIAELRDRRATAISQGEAQRAAIARALLNKPALLLADEPTSSLDNKSALQVVSLLKALSAETGATLLVSSHDERIKGEFDQAVILGSGKTMKTLTLSRLTSANIKFKPLSAIFNVLLLAMGVAIILTLVHLNDQIEQRFSKDLQGIDLVVSGKGSPLQIILSNVFHIDIPTGNIPIAEADVLKANPLVKTAIPLALGDNYNGYRIVGTNGDYIAHYKGQLAQGRLFSQQMEAVLGSEVALKNNLKIGDRIVGAHGLVNSDDLHSDFPYTLVGILNPTGGVIDRLVLTPVASVWHVHEHPDEDDPKDVEYKKEHPWNEITALLITYRSPLAAAQLPRLVNKSSSMQAASPAFEVARLTKLMGTGSDVLSAFGILLIGFSAFGLFITLYNAVNERQYDIALMRSLGATRGRIFGYVMTEVITLGIIGAVVGVGLAQLFLHATAAWIRATKHIALEPASLGAAEAYVVIAALGISVIAGILPAIKAYRVNIVKALVRM